MNIFGCQSLFHLSLSFPLLLLLSLSFPLSFLSLIILLGKNKKMNYHRSLEKSFQCFSFPLSHDLSNVFLNEKLINLIIYLFLHKNLSISLIELLPFLSLVIEVKETFFFWSSDILWIPSKIFLGKILIGFLKISPPMNRIPIRLIQFFCWVKKNEILMIAWFFNIWQ